MICYFFIVLRQRNDRVFVVNYYHLLLPLTILLQKKLTGIYQLIIFLPVHLHQFLRSTGIQGMTRLKSV